MGVRLALMVALAGCSFEPGTFTRGDGGGDDGPTTGDVPGSELDAALCESWQARHFTPCAIPPPMGGLTLTQANSPYKLVTTSGVLTDKNGAVAVASDVIMQADSSMALLISVDSLTVETGALLSVTGDKPLIVASWGPIAIDGTIDAGSHVNGNVIGAGGGAAAYCTGAQLAVKGTDETTTGGGSGGGGGGGFRGAGGAGGAGDSGRQNAGGAGGAAAAAVPMVVRGGCSGAISGKAGPDPSVSDPDAVSAAGVGGGGLQLSARTSIAINNTGRVLAGGMGGGGSPDNAACGGGGGGAGGYIGLEAPTIVFSGAPVLAANGGGGGASNLFNSPGDAGDDGGPNATRAAGGAAVGGSCSDAGGLGGAGATLTGAAAANNDVICGGAGGGGGAGHILIFSPSLDVGSAVISPAHIANPF